MGKTKKVGTAGRFGARGGTRLRKEIAKIEKKQKKWHTCPSCGQDKVKRVAMGIWKCRKCSYKFAGRAYDTG